MDGEISVTVGWEIIDAGDAGRLLALLVDHKVVSLLELTDEDFERLCS